MLGAKAQAAVATAYVSMVKSSVRVLPSRSVIFPKRMPPSAQPMSKRLVSAAVHWTFAFWVAGSAGFKPSRFGTQIGAT
jgi:hypothetical protein